MTMIERVARAIAKGEYGDNVDDVWETCIDDARAAIEAMRHIDPRIAAVVSANWTLSQDQVLRLFQQVLDAALSERPQ